MPNVTGICILRHFPGFERHCRSGAAIALSSKVEKPVDFIMETLLTTPLLKSKTSLNKPIPS
jgi:hypothetical protein